MSIIDIIVIVIAIFIMSIALLFSSVMTNEIQNLEQFQEHTESWRTINNTRTTLNSFNGYFPYIFAGLLLAVVIGAYFVHTHPVFLVISMIILVVFILISGVMVNMFNELASADQFSTVVDDYDNIVAGWQNMPLFILLSGAAVLIVLYAKSRKGGGIGGPAY